MWQPDVPANSAANTTSVTSFFMVGLPSNQRGPGTYVGLGVVTTGAPPHGSQGVLGWHGLGQTTVGGWQAGWQGGWVGGPPRHRHSMNRHPAAPLSINPMTVKISSFFIP